MNRISTIKEDKKRSIAYVGIPFKRNQDVVRVISGNQEFEYVACIVDGWNNPDELKGDVPGRKVARLVADLYPQEFLQSTIKDTIKRAHADAKIIDDTVNNLSPHYASAVASFLFHGAKEDVIVSVGDVETYLWDGKIWYKPKEISDHWIDPAKYPSNVSRFFGCWERKQYPIFSAEPDVMTIPSTTPVMIATDGIKTSATLSDINLLSVNPIQTSAKKIVEAIFHEVTRRGTQRDDISILVRGIDKP